MRKRKRYGPNLRIRFRETTIPLSPTQDPKLWWRLTCALLPDRRRQLQRLEELSFEAHEEDLKHLMVSRGLQVNRAVEGHPQRRPRASQGRFTRRALQDYAKALYKAIHEAAHREGQSLTPKQIRFLMVQDILGHCSAWRYDLPSAQPSKNRNKPLIIADRIRYLLR